MSPKPPLAPRPVADSKVEMTEIVFPNDANPLGNVMGGRIMQWLDICAAVAAGRHARTPVVTASVDRIDFHSPVPIGGVVVLLASVNFAGRTSMEVGVRVESEDLRTGRRRHTNSCYITFVAIDESGRPTEVPAVRPESREEQRRYEAAEARRARRLEERAAEAKHAEAHARAAVTTPEGAR